MLDSLRKAAGTWVAKLLLMLLVASFAVWGISGQIATGVGGDTVVTAGDTTVSTIEYRLAYDRELSVLSQQLGRPVTREQAVALGIDNRVLAQLVAGAVLDEQARRMRLGLSKQRLAELTAADPAFQGPDGRFDRVRFEYVLRQVGMRPEDYLRSRSQVAIRQQIVDAVAEDMHIPETFLDALARYRGEDRTVEYVVVPASVAGEIADPEDSVLAAWFEERKQSYRAPEYRHIAYAELTPEAIADFNAVTEEQVREEYDRNIARYTTPERRTVDQLVFATREEADAALARIRAGESFDDLVAAEGKTPQDVALGTLTRTEIPDPAIAEAAFALAEGGVSEVIEGTFGPILLRVSAVTPEKVSPFEEVADQIRRDIAVGEATRLLLDVYDRYEDLRAGGMSLVEAAGQIGITVKEVEAIDRNGTDPEGKVVSGLPEARDLLREAFEAAEGVENPAITLGRDGYLLFEVLKITPARDRTLDEVRERVLDDWKRAERDRLVAEAARAIEAKLKDGASFEEAVGERALQSQMLYGLKRDSTDPNFGSAGVQAVFDVPVEGVGSFASGESGDWIVFRVTDSALQLDARSELVPDDLRRGLDAAAAEGLLDQLIARLQEEYRVTINQAAINRALSF